MVKNEVNMNARFDQSGSPHRNSKTKIWKSTVSKQKAEDFSEYDGKSAGSYLGEGTMN